MTVAVQGGVPPYQLILLPVSVLKLGYRTPIIENITEGQTSIDFLLTFPEEAQFIAIMSDATGFGSGGVGTPTTVRSVTFYSQAPPA
jgi:hypothetical protein